MLAFFGPTPEYRPYLHTEIFNLVYHGKGGFTWESVYDMPIFLRRFYIKKINEYIEEQNKEHEKVMKKSNKKSVSGPGISPRK